MASGPFAWTQERIKKEFGHSMSNFYPSFGVNLKVTDVPEKEVRDKNRRRDENT